MTTQKAARASPELRRAPLSPRYRRNYTTPRGTTRLKRGHRKIRQARDHEYGQSYDGNQFSGGLTQTLIDRSLGWCHLAFRFGLTHIPIDLTRVFPWTCRVFVPLQVLV